MTSSAPAWLLLIVTLPGPTKSARMRLWRSMKAAGAGALRDGVYVLPASQEASALFDAQSLKVVAGGGSAEQIGTDARDAAQEGRWRAFFDRGAEHAQLLARVQAIRARSIGAIAPDVHRELAAVRREAAALAAIDFFPGPAAEQLAQALADATASLSGADEPHGGSGRVTRRDRAEYQGRVWATRRHPWVDRLASAWLIGRFIDASPRFEWLAHPEDCPASALGFDFDGATFTHTGARVTFEVLLASFGLDGDAALVRLGSIVHALDVGGAPSPEAAGLSAILSGYRTRSLDDDALLAQAAGVFDALYDAFGAADTSP